MEKASRKRYATEFLLRSSDPKLIEKLKKIADKKRLSVNSLILNNIDKVIKRENV